MQNTQRRCKSSSLLSVVVCMCYCSVVACPFRPHKAKHKIHCTLIFYFSGLFLGNKKKTKTIREHHTFVRNNHRFAFCLIFHLKCISFLQHTYLTILWYSRTIIIIKNKNHIHTPENNFFDSIVGTWTWIMHGKLPSGFFLFYIPFSSVLLFFFSSFAI